MRSAREKLITALEGSVCMCGSDTDDHMGDCLMAADLADPEVSDDQERQRR